MRLPLLTALLLLVAGTSQAQWQLQDAHTTADLRGIHSLGNGVAWASGTNGTVLRTEDAGFVWQLCAIPPGAEHLDFRGIQAFDNNTAIVMSSGKGDLSRLYKTTDGCQTWTLLFTNPDKDGFWDALRFADRKHGFLLGDPVVVAGSKTKRIVLKETIDGAKTWIPWEQKNSDFSLGEDVSAFAASNSVLIAQDDFHAIVAIGGKGGSAVGVAGNNEFPPKGFCEPCTTMSDKKAKRELNVWWTLRGPFPATDSGGIFSIALHENQIVAVGGDYKEPQSADRTAGYTSAGFGDSWHASKMQPHGYRSAVAYDPTHNAWITVGPNGTDISTDDGRNWRPLKPSPSDPPDADQHWNALSLPFVVGPHGRVGYLRTDALPQTSTKLQ